MVPLCFLANLLGPRAATETHKVALLFTTSPTYCWIRVGCLRSPCLGLHNVGQGTPRISLQRLTDRVDPLLSFFTWDEMFGFDLLEDDEDLCRRHLGLAVCVSRCRLPCIRPHVLTALERRKRAYERHQEVWAWQWTSYLVTQVVCIKPSRGL